MRLRKGFALLGALLALGATAGMARAEVKWTKSIATAQKQAKEQKKPLMIDVYTTWCGWCKVLDSTTFKDAKVTELSKSFVNLKIDAEAEGAALASKYKVEGFPTVLFVDAGGRQLNRVEGYVEAPEMVKEMQTALARAAKPAVKKPAGKSKGAAKSAVVTKTAAKAAPAARAKAGKSADGKGACCEAKDKAGKAACGACKAKAAGAAPACCAPQPAAKPSAKPAAKPEAKPEA